MVKGNGGSGIGVFGGGGSGGSITDIGKSLGGRHSHIELRYTGKIDPQLYPAEKLHLMIKELKSDPKRAIYIENYWCVSQLMAGFIELKKENFDEGKRALTSWLVENSTDYGFTLKNFLGTSFGKGGNN